ncbi:MAG: CPBP family intramembrane metalloprotease [Chloroflexota bacterium]|nr:CPBP family intramembrane metalloprotease [Chloroflexota bacterium]MDE2854264.1 CPBP family intramembrane metalloprotease [Chloroflexota bacterium]MDE2948326.1 CPBP family intramembrane metalloprotease [Chloroflexota bacterium]
MMPNAPFDPLADAKDRSQSEPETAEPAEGQNEGRSIAIPAQYRGASDPLFGFIIAAALSVGLTPLLPESVELRYALAWGALAGVSVLSWLLGSMERIGQERPDNLGWGLLYGVLLGIPFLVFLGQHVLAPATEQLFPAMTAGSLLAFLVFVMPIAETLFFRGLLQGLLQFWIVGLLATLWNIVLFFPVMWGAITDYQVIALVIVILLLTMNLLYVYVRKRNGLAAAWICQIVTNLIILYIPSL